MGFEPTNTFVTGPWIPRELGPLVRAR